ncbi:MAG: coiled-coil protein [Candidatus Woesearchaeota archaeon]
MSEKTVSNKESVEDVSSLKKKLDELNQQKEEWFSKKAEIGLQIKNKINLIKDLKKERNTLTNEVRDLKKKRNTLNKKISEKIKDIVGVERPTLKGKKVSPGRLKKEIDDLEFKLQTVPMKLESEQKLMKRLKELKKQYSEFKKVKETSESFKKVSKETDDLKDDANKFHEVLQEKADKSQEIHEKLVEESKLVDALKEEEDVAYKKFLEYKKEFTELNSQLKDTFKSMRTEHVKAKSEKKAQIKKQNEKVIEEKAKDVEEKISKKKKLTTEDLLIMQRTKN